MTRSYTAGQIKLYTDLYKFSLKLVYSNLSENLPSACFAFCKSSIVTSGCSVGLAIFFFFFGSGGGLGGVGLPISFFLGGGGL